MRQLTQKTVRSLLLLLLLLLLNLLQLNLLQPLSHGVRVIRMYLKCIAETED